MEDRDIIGLFFERDSSAIEESRRKYGAAMERTAKNILSDPQDSEECVNDAYLAAWNAIPPTRPDSLCAFVCRIARNLSLNRLRDLRRERRDRDMTLPLDELENCIPASREDASELAELLNGFLADLEESDRALFMGRYWFSYPVEELAAAVKLAPKTVYKRLCKTRERLRAYLAERGYRV